MHAPPIVFDRIAVRQNRTKAEKINGPEPNLVRKARTQLLDRLLDVTRRFKTALASGPGSLAIAKDLKETHNLSEVTSAVFRDPIPENGMPADLMGGTVFSDDEWVPFGANAFDLVISALSLHWVNDLPGALVQLRRCLVPDGFFLATLFGGTTLHELRTCLMEAETKLKGGAAPRVSPFVDVRDAGNLLVRAGFALPVADTDSHVSTYDDLASLFDEIRAMGETNAVAERSRGLTTQRLFDETEAIYKDRFCTSDGKLIATFDFVTLTGWAPADTQQKPLSPGSAQKRLSHALDTDETAL